MLYIFPTLGCWAFQTLVEICFFKKFCAKKARKYGAQFCKWVSSMFAPKHWLSDYWLLPHWCWGCCVILFQVFWFLWGCSIGWVCCIVWQFSCHWHNLSTCAAIFLLQFPSVLWASEKPGVWSAQHPNAGQLTCHLKNFNFWTAVHKWNFEQSDIL